MEETNKFIKLEDDIRSSLNRNDFREATIHRCDMLHALQTIEHSRMLFVNELFSKTFKDVTDVLDGSLTLDAGLYTSEFFEYLTYSGFVIEKEETESGKEMVNVSWPVDMGKSVPLTFERSPRVNNYTKHILTGAPNAIHVEATTAYELNLMFFNHDFDVLSPHMIIKYFTQKTLLFESVGGLFRMIKHKISENAKSCYIFHDFENDVHDTKTYNEIIKLMALFGFTVFNNPIKMETYSIWCVHKTKNVDDGEVNINMFNTNLGA